MNKVLNIISYYDSHQKGTYQVTRSGEIYVTDDSTDAFLLCMFCTSNTDKQILRTIEEFLEHIKWHRSEDNSSPICGSVTEIEEYLESSLDDYMVDELDEESENATLRNETSMEHWLPEIIDIFKKCPCLWHIATAEWEKQFVEPAKGMITKHINTLTERTESVRHVEELIEKLKSQFLEKCMDEDYKPNLYFQKLNFLLTSDMPTLDVSIYTDFQCTICKENLSSWEHLWDHLCDCHMETEENDLPSIAFDDQVENELSKKEEEERPERKEYEEGNVLHSDSEVEAQEDTAEFIEDFIEVYKNQPRLWDRNHPEYNNRRLRRESHTAFKALMERHNKETTFATIIANITKFKSKFMYAHRKVLASQERNLTYVPRLPYYDKLLFLQDSMEKRELPIVASAETKEGSQQYPTNKKPMTTSCTLCDKEFSNSKECIDHIQYAHESDELVSPDGFYYCPMCNYPNKTKVTLIRHLRNAHSLNYTKCDDCGTKFRLMTAFAKHRAKVHNDLIPFKCSECGKGFRKSHLLKIHSFIHRDVNDRPFACQICGSRFSNKGNLAIHIRRHTRDFRITCEICDFKVATSTELHSHMLTHSGDYPFICDICGKACRNKTTFEIHQERDHNGVVYPCEICSKDFRSKKSLLNHIEGHNAMADKECQFCEKKYQRSSALRKHIRKKHSKPTHARLALQVVPCEDYEIIEEIVEEKGE